MLLSFMDDGGNTPTIVNILTLILVFVLVIFMAYFAAKFVAKYQGNMLNNKSNIRILESFRVDGNKIICIAKIGENYYALALCKDNVTVIDKLNPDELNILQTEESGNTKNFEFRDILSKMKNKNSKDDSDIK